MFSKLKCILYPYYLYGLLFLSLKHFILQHSSPITPSLKRLESQKDIL